MYAKTPEEQLEDAIVSLNKSGRFYVSHEKDQNEVKIFSCKNGYLPRVPVATHAQILEFVDIKDKLLGIYIDFDKRTTLNPQDLARARAAINNLTTLKYAAFLDGDTVYVKSKIAGISWKFELPSEFDELDAKAEFLRNGNTAIGSNSYLKKVNEIVDAKIKEEHRLARLARQKNKEAKEQAKLKKLHCNGTKNCTCERGTCTC